RPEVAAVRARVPEPVFRDEPAGGMTPAESEDMARLIADCVTPNRTCIVIEHKMELIAHVCTRVCVLNAGRLIADGPPSEVFALPAVIEAYFGRAAAHA
ncbi:MAG: ABC transporter ATP-binding protein, partial [Rhodobacteraceae bacterium]|nr:ABC transporter ATP-binding protein [Paracoccaceae bacterium]